MNKFLFQDIIKNYESANDGNPSNSNSSNPSNLASENIQKNQTEAEPVTQTYRPNVFSLGGLNKTDNKENVKTESKIEFKPLDVKPVQKDGIVSNMPLTDSQNKKSKLKFVIFFSIIIVAAIALYFGISFFYKKAELVINLKVDTISFNEKFYASKAGTDVLNFTLVNINGEESRTVAAGEKKEVSEKAIGSVNFYNNFGPNPQKLLIDTRLLGTNGKIYKTKTQTVIPGLKDGKPGSVEVKIYSDGDGEEFNASKPMDFKIVGFKDGPKYEKIYAKSDKSITGGFKGLKSRIDESEKEKIISEMKTALQNKLFEEAKAQLKPGLVLFRDVNIFDFNEDDITLKDQENGETTLTIKGVFYGFIFNEDELNKNLTKLLSNNINRPEAVKDIYIKNIGNLSFSLLTEKESDNENQKEQKELVKGEESLNKDKDATEKSEKSEKNGKSEKIEDSKENNKKPESKPGVEPGVKLEKKQDDTKKEIQISERETIIFTLGNNIQVSYIINEDKILQDVLGAKIKDLSSKLSKHSSVIESHSVNVSPFWIKSLPKEKEELKLIVNYPK